MDRVLIVEDDRKTSEQLRLAITEQIDGVQVDVATTVAVAREQIDRAYAGKQPYQAVILDMRLPAESGANPTLDETLCHAISLKMPYTLIAHITAYDVDENVRRHLEVAHARQVDRSFRLTKEWDFAIELISRLKQFLYGLRIEEHMGRLFGGGAAVLYPPRPRALPSRVTRRERSITHELAALMRDISTYWSHLDPSTQLRIKNVFNVDETGDEVTVSLL